MAGFDNAWTAVDHPRNGERVSIELRQLLQRVYSELLATPRSLAGLKDSLVALLEYLNAAGRTDANCWAVDLFFCLSEGWERDWTEQNLPEDFNDLLALMGQALHDTAGAPNVAENFYCLPEQLLERARSLKADG
jgi:hypothetical protein